jgi:hypothetical protein
MYEIFKTEKNVSCLCIWEIYSIYYITSAINEKIEEAPPPLEEDRGDLGRVRLL